MQSSEVGHGRSSDELVRPSSRDLSASPGTRNEMETAATRLWKALDPAKILSPAHESSDHDDDETIRSK